MSRRFPLSLTTAYGRKNTEALSGTLLLAFMVEHFLANLLLLLDDPAPYQWYTETLGRAIVVRGLEVGLFALFLIHIGIGLHMRLQHRRLLRRHPEAPRPKDLSTRFVGWTGVIILVFLVVHLWRFFVPNRVQGLPDFDLYEQAHLAFSNVWYVLLYVVSMVALASHLRHGIRSALFSFKFLPKPLLPRIRNILSWIGFGTALGLAYIAVHIYVVGWIR